MSESNINSTDIAIIGMSGRFPDADNIENFWNNIISNKESLTRYTKKELLQEGISQKQLENNNYVMTAGILPNYDKFDNEFFEYSSRESLIMDPQQRVFLEEVWSVFENAGYDPFKYKDRVGVFAGAKQNNYLNYYNKFSKTNPLDEFELGYYAEASQLATRVSYNFNLNGPSIFISTACSTSLVVIHLACQSLLIGECDMAIAGAIALQTPHKTGYLYKPGLILSPDGHCRCFDNKANGTVLTNGVGIVLLKRLTNAIADNDRIEGIIKGTAINNDGNKKVSFNAPSVSGQAEAIAAALNFANLEPNDIDYIEAHGTGTLLGDPIEIAALKKAFNNRDPLNICRIGSVKGNIGHADIAAGMAGLIKTALAIKNHLIPATINFQKENPALKLAESPFTINSNHYTWQKSETPFHAGVSSFGIGGTNAHIILEEHLFKPSSCIEKSTNMLCISAKSPKALARNCKNLAEHLSKKRINITDVAYTLQTGRHHFNHRLAFAVNDTKDAIKKLTDPEHDINISDNKRHKIVFMFSGQGSQYIGMGAELYSEYSGFKKHIDKCAKIILKIANFEIRDFILGNTTDKNKLIKCEVSQLLIFAVEYSLANFLNSIGIKQDIMIGHSLGEYVAACLANVFTLEDVITLLWHRGKLMQQTQNGIMIAVFVDHTTIAKYLTNNISIAAINSDDILTLSGSTAEINALTVRLEEAKIRYKIVNSNFGFHSKLMEPILDEFDRYLSRIPLSVPSIPFVSNVTGKEITAEEATSREYWIKHLRKTVLFANGIKVLAASYDNAHFIEIGPGATLYPLAKRILPPTTNAYRSMSLKNDSNKCTFYLSSLVASLWKLGLDINFNNLYDNESRIKVPLPTYSFERNTFWPETNETSRENNSQNNNLTLSGENSLKSKQPVNHKNILKQIWLQYFTDDAIEANKNLFDIGMDSLLAAQFIDKINNELAMQLPISWVYENSTFHKQLSSLSTTKNQHDLIIKFNENPDNIPLFLVHPSLAGAEVYNDFVQQLGNNFTIYGIDSYSLATGRYSLNSIEKLAAKYLSEIKKIAPNGPYLLGGWSMGGLIAYEIALQLTARGEVIKSLYLFDSAMPSNKSYDSFIKIIPIQKKMTTHKKDYGRYPRELQTKLLKQIEFDNTIMSKYLNIKPYNGNAILFKAKNHPQEDITMLTQKEKKRYHDFFDQLFNDESNGWNTHIPNLKIVATNTCHYSILTNDIVINIMKKSLNKLAITNTKES